MKKIVLLALLATCMLSCTTQVAENKAKHVVFIGLDAWGSYSVAKADMPNVKRLMDQGCYTLQKRAVLPSSSAVNWASMFMGACPELHGYTDWGTQTPDIPSRVIYKNNIFPTVFQLLRDAQPDAEIGCIHEWGGIKYLVDTLSLSYREQIPDSLVYTDAIARSAVRYIKEKKPNLVAIITDNPDHVGHEAGHDTQPYYDELTKLDGFIGQIINAVQEAGMMDETIFIVTADHGGINKGHGGKTLEEVETPFIIAGKNIKQGGEFQQSMMQFDVGPTIASIFNLEQPQVWVGRPMTQVFE